MWKSRCKYSSSPLLQFRTRFQSYKHFVLVFEYCKVKYRILGHNLVGYDRPCFSVHWVHTMTFNLLAGHSIHHCCADWGRVRLWTQIRRRCWIRGLTADLLHTKSCGRGPRWILFFDKHFILISAKTVRDVESYDEFWCCWLSQQKDCRAISCRYLFVI